MTGLKKLWPRWIGKIRKALLAGGGALVAGGGGVLTADQMNLSLVTQAQVSTVLFLALGTAVSTFAVGNKSSQPSTAAVVPTIQDHLAVLQQELAAAIAPLGAHAAPETTNTSGA